MQSEKFISIDKFFFIKKDTAKKMLNQCITFVANQKSIEKNFVENAYKKNIIHTLKLPKKVLDEGVDVVIKTKFNNDYKFINIDKSKIFYEYNDLIDTGIKNINQFNLHKIKFFPPTHVSKSLIIQQLAKGAFFRPDSFSDFTPSLFKNIASVIDVFSSLNISKIEVSKYLKDLETSYTKDSLNFEIINIFILKLKRFKNENLTITLTHGDFKFEHLFILDNQLEYLIDWENTGLRSIFFDLLNFFVPWFVNRSYNYSQIKKYINEFIKTYLPQLDYYIQDKYDLYFCIFVLERYKRIHNARSIEFDLDAAYKRFNSLFVKLTN